MNFRHEKPTIKSALVLVAGALIFMKSEPTTFGFPEFQTQKNLR